MGTGVQQPNQHVRTAFPARSGANATSWGATSDAAAGSTSSDPTSRRSGARKTESPTTDRARLVSRGRATQEVRDGYCGAARRQGETLPIASSGRTTPRAPLVFPRSHSSPRAAISCRHSKVSVTNISPPEKPRRCMGSNYESCALTRGNLRVGAARNVVGIVRRDLQRREAI